MYINSFLEFIYIIPMLKIFKQKNAKNGLLKEARKRQEGYMKPGVKRREAKKEAIRNNRRNNRDYR